MFGWVESAVDVPSCRATLRAWAEGWWWAYAAAIEDHRGSRVPMSDAASRAVHRAQVTANQMARTGIDEALIAQVVHGFYAKVRADAELGPVFAARITDWEPHLATMCRFWSSVTLKTAIYSGSPMQRHAPLAVSGAHFDRWMALFTQTVVEVCPPAAAAVFLEAAGRIAQSLEFGIAAHRGLTLAKGERLPTA